MNDKSLITNNINYNNNNDILSEIITKIQNVINDISDKKETDYIINKLKEIIISISNIIEDNKKNY